MKFTDCELKSISMSKGNKFVVFDRESTGFQPNAIWGKILEIGAVKIENGEIVGKFEELCNPEMKIPKKITELTGITNDMVKSADTYPGVIKRFLEFCDGYTLVAHNAIGDIKFLEFFGEKMGLELELPCIDTVHLCRIKDKLEKSKNSKYVAPAHKLQTVVEYYGIPEFGGHRAYNDANATGLLFILLRESLKEVIFNNVNQKDLILEYADEIPSEYLPQITRIANNCDDIRIINVNFWEVVHHKRLYVEVKASNEYYKLFYDFIKEEWKMREGGFLLNNLDELVPMVCKHKGIVNEKDFYKIGTWKGD